MAKKKEVPVEEEVEEVEEAPEVFEYPPELGPDDE